MRQAPWHTRCCISMYKVPLNLIANKGVHMKFAKVVLSAVMMMSIVSVAKAGGTMSKCSAQSSSHTLLDTSNNLTVKANTVKDSSSGVTTEVHGNGAVR